MVYVLVCRSVLVGVSPPLPANAPYLFVYCESSAVLCGLVVLFTGRISRPPGPSLPPDMHAPPAGSGATDDGPT